MTLRRSLLAGAALLACAVATGAHAQGTPERIRGVLASVQGDALVVHVADATDVTVPMNAGWAIRSIKAGTLDSIKPGAAIGIVSRGPADHPIAVAIQVFPPGPPPPLGQSPWDMMPESTMTNGMVSGEVSAKGDHGFTVTFGDKSVPVTTAPNVSVGVAGAGDKAMLVPGAHVVVFSTRGADGSHAGRLAIVGLDGAVPPL